MTDRVTHGAELKPGGDCQLCCEKPTRIIIVISSSWSVDLESMIFTVLVILLPQKASFVTDFDKDGEFLDIKNPVLLLSI